MHLLKNTTPYKGSSFETVATTRRRLSGRLPMHYLRIIILPLLLSLICGCSVLQGAKLLAPESFGMTPVALSIFIETGADEATRVKLLDAMGKAEIAIHTAYGSVKSRPVVHACISEGCYEAFGGRGSAGKTLGNRILLSLRGLMDWHYLAHEWSHAEIFSRLTLSASWHMPQWFNEGVAVAVSDEPGHSESHWQFLVASNTPRPTREELHTFKSLRQWLDAVHRYGDDKNIERRAKGEHEIYPVYSAAGHELRPWLANVGTHGLLAFIGRMNGGDIFESAYRTAYFAVEKNTTPPSP